MKAPFDKELHNYIYEKKNKSYYINVFLNIFDKMAPETIFFAGEFNRLPFFFYYLGGFIWNAGWLGLLIYFLYSTYVSTSTSSFVSLQSDNGICSEVPLSVTGSFKIDNYGYWEGEREFKPEYALMIGSCKAFTSTDQNYSKLVTNVAERYYNISKKSMYRDLAYNLNVLASAYTLDTTMGRIEVEPTGTIGHMLHKEYSIISAIKDSSDLLETNPDNIGCFGKSGTKIDVSTNVLSAEFVYHDASDHCKSIAKTLGYGSKYGEYGSNFNFNLDLASFSTAVAVNNMVLSVKDLISIGRYAYNYTLHNKNDDYFDDDRPLVRKTKRSRRKLSSIEEIKILQQQHKSLDEYSEMETYTSLILRELTMQTNGSSKYNYIITSHRFVYASKYDGMKPIFCFIFDHNQDKAICFPYVRLRERDYVLMYPIMKHYSGTNCLDDTIWGSSWYDHISEILQSSSNWVNDYDHTVDIMLGLVIFPDLQDAVAFAYEAYNIIQSNEDGDLIIANRFYEPMKLMIDVHFTNINASNYPSQNSLCGINYFKNNATNIDCFMITINNYGSNFYTNANKYQLFAGACRNSIFKSELFARAIKIPPTKLIQTYYSCKPTIFDAVFNSIGLSLGNTGLYMMVAWGCFCFILTIILWYFFDFNPKMHIYPQEDENHVEEKVNLSKKDEIDSISTLSFY